ncbi:class I SAM-dependent methyltransferase [Cumulibacter soli]|uniref:methyltransferase domain-containing protein n=1 Tax=Cumulibacter soli TaxID=2546344 RepID=UPI0010680D0F|nr:class I SAM-dependent methyltransferase [Cumulibacter soli]
MTVSPDFDRLYVEETDPWSVGSSWYEQRKVAVVLAALAERRYTRALDPACGTGHLARALADRCDDVVACDASEAAVAVARDVCADASNMTLDARRLPYDEVSSLDSAVGETGRSSEQKPAYQAITPSGDILRISQRSPAPRGPFDLIVLSEFLYYLSGDERAAAVAEMIERAADRVEIVAVHWRERADGAVSTGEDVHEELRGIFAARRFRHQVAHFDEEFVLDVFTRGHDHYIS